MGYRNYLYICQHCGIVQATASETAPKACFVCDGLNFSDHYSNEVLREKRNSSVETEQTVERELERVSIESVR